MQGYFCLQFCLPLSDLSSQTRTAAKCIMCSTYDFSPDLIAKLECYIITRTLPIAFTLNNMQITWCMHIILLYVI